MAEDISIRVKLENGKLVSSYGKTAQAIKKRNKEIGGSMDATKSSSMRLETALKGLVAGFGGLYIISKINSLFKESIRLFDQQAEAEAKVAQTIRSTGMAAGLTFEELNNMAKGFQAVTRYGDETVLQGQALLLTFKKIGKEQFPEATETMLDMATAMGTDLKSAALQLGKALEDPGTQMSMLRRSGVSFSNEQIAMARQMQATGDIAGAQALVLKEVRSQFGGLARAAADAGAGPLIQFQNRINDMKETMGKALMPVLIETMERIENMFKIGTGGKELEETMYGVAATARVAIGAFTDFANTIMAIGKLGLSLTWNFRELRTAIQGTFSKSAREESMAAGELADKLRLEGKALLENTGAMLAAMEGREQWIEQEKRLAAAREKLNNTASRGTPQDGGTQGLASKEGLEIEKQIAGMREAFLQRTHEGRLQILSEQRNQLLEAARKHGEDAKFIELEYQQKVADEVTQAMESRFETQKSLMQAELAEKRRMLEEEARIEEERKTLVGQTATMYLSAFREILGANKSFAVGIKTIAATEAFISTWLTAQKMAEQAAKLPPPFGLTMPPVIYGAAIARGLAGVANIKKAARGIDYVTTGPEFIKVGDNPGGRERVSVTPISSPNYNGPQAASSFSPTIIINNSMDSERTAQAVKNTVFEQYQEFERFKSRSEAYRL